MTHVLIHRDPRRPVESSGGLLLDWQRYDQAQPGSVYRKTGDVGHLNSLATAALFDAIGRGRDVTIAQTAENPEATPAAEMEAALFALRPVTLVCPERPTGTRWISAWCGSGSIAAAVASPMAAGAVQPHLDAQATAIPKFNQGGRWYTPPNILLRHYVNGESIGIVQPERVTPEMVLASLGDDPAVREAGARWDRATPATHRALAQAVDNAQAARGIPEHDRVYLTTSQVDSYMLPIAMRMGRNDEVAVIGRLRREFRTLYGDLAERVLAFVLRVYDHANADALRRAHAVP